MSKPPKGPEPGSFYGFEEDSYAELGVTNNPGQSREGFEPEVSENLIEEFQLANSEFAIDPKVVYYPCCGTDVSAVQAYPNAKVILLDHNDFRAGVLRKSGLEVIQADALQYVPQDEVDLVILQNPQIDPDFMARTVRAGGYVICNNYSHTASKMAKLVDFELLGMIKRLSDKEPMQVLRDGLDEYLYQSDNAFGNDYGQFIFKRKIFAQKQYESQTKS